MELGQSQQSAAGLTVYGWGSTQHNQLADVLQQGSVTTLPSATCQTLFRPFGSVITDRMLCVTGRVARAEPHRLHVYEWYADICYRLGVTSTVTTMLQVMCTSDLMFMTVLEDSVCLATAR